MTASKTTKRTISLADYRALAEFRYHIRRYLDFSDQAAKAVGVEPQQYQLLLSIKGMAEGADPTVGALAENLHIRHHSAVELVNRAERNGLVKRSRPAENRSFVFVRLTRKGEDIVSEVVPTRMEELRTAGPVLVETLNRLIKANRKRIGK